MDPYPYKQIAEGLERHGYDRNYKYLKHYTAGTITPLDLLITWTLWRQTARRACADAHATIGGATLCMEHGWIREVRRRQYYQLAYRVGTTPGINGWGHVVPGGPERWHSWGIRLKPWRTTGSHILVCTQRGVKPNDPDITHGAEWANRIYDILRKSTDRPIHWRPHPGNRRPCLPTGERKVDKLIDPHVECYESNLRDAWCTVVYSSTAANESIIRGIPVLFDGQRIMLHKLAGRPRQASSPPMPDREPELERAAWYQWSAEEFQSGEAFEHVLKDESTSST